MSNPAENRKLEDIDADVVHVGLYDYAGVFRERRLRKEQFIDWAAAPRFANVLAHWDSADNLFGGGPFLSEPLELDLGSVRKFGFEENAVSIIADFVGPNRALMPRQVLREQLGRAERLGYDVKAAFEFEVIFVRETSESLRQSNFAPPKTFVPENRCWSGQTAAEQAQFVAGLEKVILDHGVGLYSVAGELGPGCFEATLLASSGLRAADDACFFRTATRAYARSQGMTASFMPSMGAGFPGIGGHINLSLIDRKTGGNVFSDATGSTNQLARHFIGGMVQLVPEAFAFAAHTVNAYRRFAPGSWAPKSVTWAEWTFTTAVRSAPSASENARLEFRLPGADCNPYLALALMLAGGLNGIENAIEPPAATPNGGPDDIPAGATRLPLDLHDASRRLKESASAREAFGPAFVDHFANVCAIEHASLAKEVSSAELRRYLEA
ncbi:MAG TPA: hypothetical protein VN112_18140 [Ensifer sp.]|nr:hypothetical protein [Ensifer sp.]